MNYIKIFEEFNNIQIEALLNKLGKRLPKFGTYKICFEFGKKSIIKFFQIYDEEEIYNCIKQRNLNLNTLPKIYKVGVIKPKSEQWFQNIFSDFINKIEFDINENIYFVIEEKLIINTKLKILFKDLIMSYHNHAYKKGYLRTDVLEELQEAIYNLNDENTLLENINIGHKLEIYKKSIEEKNNFLFNHLIKIYTNLLNNDIIVSDSNPDNYGINHNGNIVVFDLANQYDYLKVFNYKLKNINEKDLNFIF